MIKAVGEEHEPKWVTDYNNRPRNLNIKITENMNETQEQKPLTKHIQTAVNAIEKQIEKYEKQITKLNSQAQKALGQADELRNSVVGLAEQIEVLKKKS